MGYLSFAFLATIALLIFLLQRPRRSGQKTSRLIVAALLACILFMIATLPAARSEASALLDITIFSKTKSFSYEQRGEMDADAWQTARMTNWLGAGFGICRGSSFIPTQFGGVGVPGMTLLAVFIFLLFKPAWRSRSSAMAFLGQPLLAASVSLFGMAVAGPEITSPSLWLFFAACTLTAPRVPVGAFRPAISNAMGSQALVV